MRRLNLPSCCAAIRDSKVISDDERDSPIGPISLAVPVIRMPLVIVSDLKI